MVVPQIAACSNIIENIDEALFPSINSVLIFHERLINSKSTWAHTSVTIAHIPSNVPDRVGVTVPIVVYNSYHLHSVRIYYDILSCSLFCCNMILSESGIMVVPDVKNLERLV